MSTQSKNSSDSSTRGQPVTVLTVQAKRERGERLTMVTAYDYPTALFAERAEIDMILVGDSLAMVVLGHDDTLSVTMDEMIHHARAVRRGAETPLVIGDLPFMSYQVSVADAVRNAGRFVQEAGVDAVKLEGGRHVVDRVRAITQAGIPVQGHIGLTPQSVNALGGWRVQGRTAEAAKTLIEDARALEAAGCFSLVLESVPDRLARHITDALRIPTIGIGAGPGTSGQVLVVHDLLGIFDRFKPRFVKRFAALGTDAVTALRAYADEVGAGTFPGPEHSYTMPDEEWAALRAALRADGSLDEPDRADVSTDGAARTETTGEHTSDVNGSGTDAATEPTASESTTEHAAELEAVGINDAGVETDGPAAARNGISGCSAAAGDKA